MENLVFDFLPLDCSLIFFATLSLKYCALLTYLMCFRLFSFALSMQLRTMMKTKQTRFKSTPIQKAAVIDPVALYSMGVTTSVVMDPSFPTLMANAVAKEISP